jgi:hypothetical protein
MAPTLPVPVVELLGQDEEQVPALRVKSVDQIDAEVARQ